MHHEIFVRYLLDSKGRKATEESEIVAAAAIAAAAELEIRVDAPIKEEKVETEKKQDMAKKEINEGEEEENDASARKDNKREYIYGDDGAVDDDYRRGDNGKKLGSREAEGRGGRESVNYGKASSSSLSGMKTGSAAHSLKPPDSGTDMSNLFVRYVGNTIIILIGYCGRVIILWGGIV